MTQQHHEGSEAHDSRCDGFRDEVAGDLGFPGRRVGRRVCSPSRWIQMMSCRRWVIGSDISPNESIVGDGRAQRI